MRLLSASEPTVSRPQDRRRISARLTGIQTAITILFAALALAFWYFQVVQYPKFRELAENNHQRTLSLRAPRGVLYDRHGRRAGGEPRLVRDLARARAHRGSRSHDPPAVPGGAARRGGGARHRAAQPIAAGLPPDPGRGGRLARPGVRGDGAAPRHRAARRAGRARAHAALPLGVAGGSPVRVRGPGDRGPGGGRRAAGGRHRRPVGAREGLQPAADGAGRRAAGGREQHGPRDPDARRGAARRRGGESS